ncbi:hypothetical protein FA95DRAFT_1047501 [Auriscalpium vulgare]|uniref:Uncharacterized protein n=1 Tax=Auriscalpium vulgare TaxID=40419 RepID=A0ACB8S9H7_9AGAM|nr:hypothetical protein FA95DRAFT_1047501 [Auriscalpium vulgare]
MLSLRAPAALYESGSEAEYLAARREIPFDQLPAAYNVQKNPRAPTLFFGLEVTHAQFIDFAAPGVWDGRTIQMVLACVTSARDGLAVRRSPAPPPSTLFCFLYLYHTSALSRFAIVAFCISLALLDVSRASTVHLSTRMSISCITAGHC